MKTESNIEAIFFDFGGVLLQTFDGVDHDAIEAEFGLERKQLRKMVYVESRYMDLQVGKCTLEDWTESVRATLRERLGERASPVFRAYFEAEHKLNPQMLELVQRLQGQYTLGIISNTIPGMEDRLRERPELDWFSIFDVRIGSGDLGIAKPDPRIFLHAAKSAGAAPSGCVFTDDVRSFADAAREVGMHGFQFIGYEQFVADLQSVGVIA